VESCFNEICFRINVSKDHLKPWSETDFFLFFLISKQNFTRRITKKLKPAEALEDNQSNL